MAGGTVGAIVAPMARVFALGVTMVSGFLTALLLVAVQAGEPPQAPPQQVTGADSPTPHSQKSPDDPSSLVPGIAIEDLAQIVPSALPLGERLLFLATVEWQGASVLVGYLELATWEESDSRMIIHARGRGQRFGYSIDQRIVSTMEAGGKQPISFMNTQRGTEHHTKKLIFDENKISFSKRSHCRISECKNKHHLVSEVAWKGPIPWGTKQAHCASKDCEIALHENWLHVKDHEVEEPYVDLLTAIYVARTSQFPAGDEPMIIPVVNDDSRWYVQVQPRSRQQISVKEGDYDAIEMALNPIPSDGNEKKRFEGLFGIHGTLRVWFDSQSGRPVLIEGMLPFAYLNLKARIELISVGDAAVVQARHSALSNQESDKSLDGPR